MSWSDLVPSLIALFGIPLAVLFGWLKDRNLKDQQNRREDLVRREQHQRENEVFEQQAYEWRAQQWWQRKADAYTEIVEALWQRLEYGNEYLAELYNEHRAQADDKTEKYRDMGINRTKLRRAADIGAFVISDEVADALQQYFMRDQKIMSMDDVVEQVEADIESTRECLGKIRMFAVRDLRVVTR